MENIEYLKRNCPKIPDLKEVDEIADPMVVAHYSGEYLCYDMEEPRTYEHWIIAGEDIEFELKDGTISKDFRCFGIAKIFYKEMGYFDLLGDVLIGGATFDKDWKPVPLSKFKWGE